MALPWFSVDYLLNICSQYVLVTLPQYLNQMLFEGELLTVRNWQAIKNGYIDITLKVDPYVFWPVLPPSFGLSIAWSFSWSFG